MYLNVYMNLWFQTILQLMVTKLSTNDTVDSEFLKGYRFKETVKEFALHSRLVSIFLFTIFLSPTYFYVWYFKVTNDESIKYDQNDTKPLLRYPLDNITKVKIKCF